MQSDSSLQLTALSLAPPQTTWASFLASNKLHPLPPANPPLLFSWLPHSHQSRLKGKYPFLIEDVPAAQCVLVCDSNIRETL